MNKQILSLKCISSITACPLPAGNTYTGAVRMVVLLVVCCDHLVINIHATANKHLLGAVASSLQNVDLEKEVILFQKVKLKNLKVKRSYGI